jgi:hypothetical protein
LEIGGDLGEVTTGAKTPSFVRYVLQYSLPILLPLYVLVWWIFLR